MLDQLHQWLWAGQGAELNHHVNETSSRLLKVCAAL